MKRDIYITPLAWDSVGKLLVCYSVIVKDLKNPKFAFIAITSRLSARMTGLFIITVITVIIIFFNYKGLLSQKLYNSTINVGPIYKFHSALRRYYCHLI